MSLSNFFIETIFPSRCYNCKKYGEFLCQNCYKQINNINQIQCPHCSRRLPEGKLNLTCRNFLNVNRLFIVSNYRQKAINTLIKDIKYKRAYILSNNLTAFACWWLKKENYAQIIKQSSDIIIPVPSHIKKLKQRGFNHAEKIGENIAQLLNIPLETNILKKIKTTPSQVDVANKEDRKNNVKNAYSVQNKEKIKNKIILLVDDVVTTGATLKECSKTLRKAGAKEIWALALTKD